MLTGTPRVLLAAASGVALVVVAAGVASTPNRSDRLGGCCHLGWRSDGDANDTASSGTNRVSASHPCSSGGSWSPGWYQSPSKRLDQRSVAAPGHGVGHLLVYRGDAEAASASGTTWHASADGLDTLGPNGHAALWILLVWTGTDCRATFTPIGVRSPQCVRVWPCSGPTAWSCRSAALIVPDASMIGLAHVRRVASRSGDAASLDAITRATGRTMHNENP